MTDETPCGPLDVPTLETLGRRAETLPLVRDWTFRPDRISPRVLEVRFDAEQYPAGVEAVRLDVRWFTDGTYSFHYREATEGDSWECRFDRHPKPDAPTIHYHPPPDGGSAEASPLNESHPLDCLFWVCAWIEDRVQGLHESSEE